MPINSKEKGKRGELAFSKFCREHGYETRRGQQYAGASGDADVIGLPKLHVEVKNTERLDLRGAMAQSISDSREGETPIVAHKKNNCEWLITMRAKDFMPIYREWEASETLKRAEAQP